MRLICPNCEAQYDVADDAIPPGGRDVQCSNCQLSWFQTEKPTVPGRSTLQLSTPRRPDPVDTPDDAMSEETAIDDSESAETPEPAEQSAPEPEEKPAAPQRKPLDDAVASILREEAAVSNSSAASTVALAAAAPEPAMPEPKPKVAAPTPEPAAPPPTREATSATPAPAITKPPATEVTKPPKPVTADETRLRIAQMTADEGGTRTGTQRRPTAAAAASNDGAQEAHLRTVPSINEINATLRARAQANDTSGLTEHEKEEAVQRKGFRRGFFWVLVILAILILPYVFADEITETLPQTTDVMASYVVTVDQLRLMLSDMINDLTGQ